MEFFEFEQWLVGVTDGNGNFDVTIRKNSCRFVFKINLSVSNIQLLYYIKKKLKFGSVTIDKKTKRASFVISDPHVLNKVILPIFENFSLLTIKYFEYYRFKKSIEIVYNKDLIISEKHLLISNIINQPLINSAISPIWVNQLKDIDEIILIKKLFPANLLTKLMKVDTERGSVHIFPRGFHNYVMNERGLISFLHSVISLPNSVGSDTKAIDLIYKLVKLYKLDSLVTRDWLIGFIEVQGFFDLSMRNKNSIVHRFTLIQKQDVFILAVIKSKFHISSKIKYNSKNNYFILETTNSRAIENIIDFFSGKNRNKTSMKGTKGLVFRIWQRSYVKYKNNTEKLIKIKNLIQKLREKLKE